MITTENFSLLLQSLDFIQADQLYYKTLANQIILTVDFKNELLIFPEEKGLKINERQTCNFKAQENFVVFECVHRLLEKGYKPEHIELEPKWKLGHGASGGRADIQIKDNDGNILLIIECKTAGEQFNKAWKNTQEDGGQLFGYAANSEPDFLSLYTADFNENDNKVTPVYYLISLKDNIEFLNENKNKNLPTFANSKRTREALFNVWKNTYQQEPITKGLFENSVPAYQLGQQKMTLEDLQTLSNADIQAKYHEFATIMRQHNISGRENAFDKLVNLFLCKIVDESNNSKKEIDQQELQFYWKGFSYDNYFDLIDRLQNLYQAGMYQFLNEKVTYIRDNQVEEAFRYVKQKPNATRDTIKDFFKQLKYFTNNDFAFIDVHNENLFYQNGIVLLKMVRMLQDIKLLQHEQKNQFLGDLFEGFLDNGIKQSEGQFFTPMPICRFILQSLPLESVFANSTQPPKAIDYACGAGHFLNELASQITPFVKQHSHNTPQNYYQQFYGIEKEYRLSKVAKVSAFMYGQDEINILYHDALASHEKIENESFSVLVANPPYSVKGFLSTLNKNERLNYEIFKAINEKNLDSNNSIETFFLERAKQLLKSGGVAAIIVPSSILSNSDSTYTATRELLIAYFDIVAIVEFGSATFGKTGTNTVVLFLRKKVQDPTPADHYRARVACWFIECDGEDSQVYQDVGLIDCYCQHIGIPIEAYHSLLNDEISEELLATELFSDYKNAFNHSTEIKTLEKQKWFKDKNPADKEIELKKRFVTFVQNIEKDKLYYFVLAFHNPQKVLVVKSPSDNKAQKTFLGYEWSAAKGNEGIKLITDANRNHMTPLYDPVNRNNPEKINFLITQNFLNAVVEIPEILQSYVSQVNLVDMLDFSRVDFNKTISLTDKKSILEIKTKWDLVKLGDICNILIGGTPSRKIQSYFSGDHLWVSISEMKGQVITNTKEKITNEAVKNSNVKLIPKGTTLLSFKLSIGKTAIAGSDLYTNEAIAGLIPKNKATLLDSYLFQLFTANYIDLENTSNKVFGKSLNSDFLKNEVKIPLPDLDIQEKIVAECEVVDKEVENAEQVINQARESINLIFSETNFNFKRLDKIVLKVSENIDPQQKNGEVNYIGLENIESETGHLVGEIKTDYSTIKSIKNCFKKYDILYGKLRPNLNKVYLAEIDGICSTDILVFRFENEPLAKFYAHYFLTKKFNDEILKTVTGQQLPRTSWEKIQTIKIPVLDLETQKMLVAEIEILETKIAIAQQIINDAAAKKQAILKSYL